MQTASQVKTLWFLFGPNENRDAGGVNGIENSVQSSEAINHLTFSTCFSVPKQCKLDTFPASGCTLVLPSPSFPRIEVEFNNIEYIIMIFTDIVP